MATAIPFGDVPQVYNNGSALSGGKIYFYVPGTSTLRTPYSDTALTVPTTNPVLLNSAGWPATNIYLDSSLAYDYIIKSADDASTLWPRTTIPAASAELFDATTAAIAALNVADGQIIRATGTDTFEVIYFDNYCNVRDYGATGDGSTDDTTAVQAAITAANSTSHKTVYFPAGTYKCTGQLTLNSGATWVGDGPGVSVIKADSALGNQVFIKTATTSGTIDVFDQSDITLRGIHVQGFDAVLTTTASEIHASLMRLWKIDGLLIEDCKFSGHRYIMLSLGGVKNFAIENCEFTDWGRTDELDPSTAAISVTSITSASTTATVTTGSAHGYTTGQSIIIDGATQTEYNGTYTVTVTSSTTFTYTFAGSGTSPATGTITCYPQLTLPANEGGAAIWIAANPIDDTASTFGTIRNNYFHDAEWSCVYLLGQNLDFSFNRMENFKEGNFAASTSIFSTTLPGASESQNITYIGNFHKGVTERLIQATGFECGGINVIVANNYFEACDGAAFDFTDAAENCVGTGNVCINCATSAYSAEYASIMCRLTDVTAKACNGITISNNVIRSEDDGQHGIRLYRISGSDTFNNIRVVNNDLLGAAADPADNLVFDATTFGTNVVIEGNNGASDYAVSTTWTPTISASSGTLTTTSTPTARYWVDGPTVHFTIAINLTDIGTGAGTLRFTLPTTPAYAGACVGTNTANGKGVHGNWGTTTTVNCTYYDGTFPAISGHTIRISGVYMTA